MGIADTTFTDDMFSQLAPLSESEPLGFPTQPNAPTAFEKFMNDDDFFTRLLSETNPVGLSSRKPITPAFEYVVEYVEVDIDVPDVAFETETEIQEIISEIQVLKSDIEDDPEDDEDLSLKNDYGQAVAALQTLIKTVSRPTTRKTRSLQARTVRRPVFA